MKQSSRLILSKTTIAKLNRQKAQSAPGVKNTAAPAFTEPAVADTNIPTSYTTPVCTTAPGVLIQ